MAATHTITPGILDEARIPLCEGYRDTSPTQLPSKMGLQMATGSIIVCSQTKRPLKKKVT